MKTLATEMRRRLPWHALMICIVWPLGSTLLAAVDIQALPYYQVRFPQALAGATAGIVVLGWDVAVVAVLALLGSVTLFATLATAGLVHATTRRALAAEPAVALLAVFFGAALQYPGVLTHPLLSFAYPLPTLVATAILGAGAVAAAAALSEGTGRLVVAAAVLGLGVLLPLPVARNLAPQAVGAGRAPLVVLGLDSLSHADDLRPLHDLTDAHGGTWYEWAVTPGLLTNAVWTSLLAMEPVHEHGVFHTFQDFPSGLTDTLVARAHRAGFRTVSVFPDQLTCGVGSQAGFDEDRSGPAGWRQLATSMVENASLLLPIVRPVLPAALLGPVPGNHAGTFTYDLDRELRGIFGEGDRGGRAFLVAHTTYLHTPRYPSYRELTPAERHRVLWAAAGSLRDRTLDWQDTLHDFDALDLRAWKVRRLEAAVVRAIDETDFFAPGRGGQLVLLSDHGARAGLTPATFWKAEYHHVPFATIGLPGRDPAAPISLIDLAELVGLAPEQAPHDPRVEFTMSAPTQWPALVASAQLHWDGSVALNDAMLRDIFRGLRGTRPWPAEFPARVFLVFGAPQPRS